MSWNNEEKPSVISSPLWGDNFPWDDTAFSYIELIWQYTPTNIWTNETI